MTPGSNIFVRNLIHGGVDSSVSPGKETDYHTAKTKRRKFKQIFPEKDYRGLSPNFHIHVSVSESYISAMGLPFLLEEIRGPILGIYK
jgi:hypothetical protein